MGFIISKKGLSNFAIVMVVISLITFLVLLFSIISYSSGIGYEQSLITCNKFIKSVNGEEIFFDRLNSPTSKFEQSVSTLCSSKTVFIDDKSVKPLVDLANDCWNKHDKGYYFLGEYSLERQYYFYCGKAIVEKDIKNFDEKYLKVINEGKYKFNESRNSVNLNLLYFTKGNLISELDEGDEILVYYGIFKDPNFKLDGYDKMKIWFEGMISDSGGFSGLLTKTLADTSSVDSHAGVFMMKNKSMDILKEDSSYTFIPIKNYED